MRLSPYWIRCAESQASNTLLFRPSHTTSNLRIRKAAVHSSSFRLCQDCGRLLEYVLFLQHSDVAGLLSSRSVPSIVHDSTVSEQRGWEINLISQDTSSFGRSRPVGACGVAAFHQCLGRCFWVRLFYCYPNTFTDEALAAFAGDKRFCAYLDMPFQHIEDNVLRKMNRKITRSQIEQKMEEERVLPEVAWRTTIVGFPTETEEAFEDLLEFVAAGHFTHVGVSLFSRRQHPFSTL